MTNEENWVAYSSRLREALIGEGVTPQAADWMLADMGPRFIEASGQTPIDHFAELDARMRARAYDYGRGIIEQFVAQMIRLERAVYELKFGKSALTDAAGDAARVRTEPPAGTKAN